MPGGDRVHGESLAVLPGMRLDMVRASFWGKEWGSRKPVSWQPDFVTSAAHGAVVTGLGFCGAVSLLEVLLR